MELERLGRRVTLRNPRIVNLETTEHRLSAALRPFFRAADFPGFVLLDEDTEHVVGKTRTPELRTLIAELALRDAERDQSQRRDESSPSP